MEVAGAEPNRVTPIALEAFLCGSVHALPQFFIRADARYRIAGEGGG